MNLTAPYENSGKIFIIGLLLLNFFFLAYYSHATNLNCVETDQSAYLSTAIWLKEHGGPLNFLTLCFTGEYKEANRHPLYLLLITPFASRDIKFFPRAKLVSTFVAFLFIIVFFFLVKREFGFLVSVVSVGLLITSSVFVRYFSWVACEYLLIAFTFLTWYFTTKGFENNKLWIWAGAFNGAAYLSKTTGIFLLLAFILTAVIVSLQTKSIKTLLKTRHFYFYFLAFIMIAFPLLIRNTLVYNNPIYNYNSKILWLDNWEQHLSPELMEKASLSNYLQTHSIGTLVPRFFSGMRIQFYGLRNSFENLILHFESYYKEQFYLAALFFLSIICLVADKTNHRKLYTAVLFITFYSTVSFCAACGGASRYFMFITSILLIYMGIGMINASKKVMKVCKIKEINYNKIITSSLIVLLLLSFFAAIRMVNSLGPAKNPLDMYAFSDGEEDIADWMIKNLKDTDVVYQTPYLKPYILTSGLFFPIKGEKINIPPLANFQEFTHLLEKTRATYVILTPGGRGDFSRRKNLFKDYIGHDPENGLYLKTMPSGWELEYSDKEKPTDFLVFKTSSQFQKSRGE